LSFLDLNMRRFYRLAFKEEAKMFWKSTAAKVEGHSRRDVNAQSDSLSGKTQLHQNFTLKTVARAQTGQRPV
jgi:hypothetical protein